MLVAGTRVRDLLDCAKHLLVAARAPRAVVFRPIGCPHHPETGQMAWGGYGRILLQKSARWSEGPRLPGLSIGMIENLSLGR
jgi:hypothetical protein